jgi:hypothetical protein
MLKFDSLENAKGATESPLNVLAGCDPLEAGQHSKCITSSAAMALVEPILSGHDAPPIRLFENPNGSVSEWMGVLAEVTKKYSNGEIDKAGKILSSLTSATKEQEAHAMEVMDNWRLSHAHPMDAARVTLETHAKTASHNPTFGNRLKTESSIRAKLQRESKMQLSNMQDVGGCRVILLDMGEVDELIKLYAADPNAKITDYVRKPRVSGYRGKHIIYSFDAGNGKTKIEIQVRTELQHSWATAIEVCSTFTDQNLKSDHPVCKDERWVRFFALMGSAMALGEGGGMVPDTPQAKAKLLGELRELADALKVTEVMKRWNTVTEIVGSQSDTSAHNFLIELQTFDHIRAKVNVTAYEQGREREAAENRVRRETEARSKMGVQVALVGVQSIGTLQTAYPNYFSDTTRFVKEVEIACKGIVGSPFPISTVG